MSDPESSTPGGAAVGVQRLVLHLRLERDDSIPAFGAFLRCVEPGKDDPVILLNVAAAMIPEMEYEDGSPVTVSRQERKRAIIEHLMHEFGHALETHFSLPVNEEAIEAACQSWESAYGLVAQSAEAADLKSESPGSSPGQSTSVSRNLMVDAPQEGVARIEGGIPADTDSQNDQGQAPADATPNTVE